MAVYGSKRMTGGRYHQATGASGASWRRQKARLTKDAQPCPTWLTDAQEITLQTMENLPLGHLGQVDECSFVGVRAPPGLEDVPLKHVGRTRCHVGLVGLPKDLLLNRVMLDTVIEQAGFSTSEVTGYTFHWSSSSTCAASERELVLAFTSIEAAQRCQVHFHGCQWGRASIRCRILTDVSQAESKSPTQRPTKSAPSLQDPLQTWWEARGSAAQASDERTLAQCTAMAKKVQASKQGLSPTAQVFVPRPPGIIAKDEGGEQITDANTDVGESELSDAATEELDNAIRSHFRLVT